MPDELGDLGVVDADLDTGRLLQPVQDVEPAPTAISPELVGAVGNTLKLLKHEAGNDELLVDHAGLGDVGDATVDDDRGVEHERPRPLTSLENSTYGMMKRKSSLV